MCASAPRPRQATNTNLPYTNANAKEDRSRKTFKRPAAQELPPALPAAQQARPGLQPNPQSSTPTRQSGSNSTDARVYAWPDGSASQQRPTQAPVTPEDRRSGFDGAVALGLHSYSSEANVGFRASVFLGGRLVRAFSLGGKVDVDIFQVEPLKDVLATSAVAVMVSVAPTFRIPLGGRSRLLLSARGGVYSLRIGLEKPSKGQTGEVTATGIVAGTSAAFGFPVGPLLLGPMASIDVVETGEICARVSGDEACDSVSGGGAIGAPQGVLWF